MLPSSSDALRTVLVADDDEPTRILVRAALEPDGWTVEEAADGTDACESIDRVQPDIVLLDVGMPNLDGFEACARLRTMRGGRHIPVMMITARDDPESVSRAYEVGATDYLSKPVNFTILRQRLHHLYRAHQDSRDLRNERDFVSAVVDHSAALVLTLDPAGRIVRFNERCVRASGFEPSEVKDKLVWDILSRPEERDGERAIFERLTSERGTNHYEGCWRTKDGSRREIAWFDSVLVNGDDEVEHVVCTGLDITKRHQAEERLRFLASYDPLTGLPNRRLVAERLQKAIVAADADGLRLGVILLDLDRFKHINATLGHSRGDLIIKEVAERLARSLRLSDVLSRQAPDLRMELGRLVGDEFTILLPGVPNANAVASIIERLQGALSRPFKVENEEYSLTASVGATIYPDDQGNAENLLGNAASAMHAARDRRRGTYHFYSESMQSNVSARLSLETELRQAVEREQLVLHYQPKVLTETGIICGAEALVRWQHPSRGLVAPDAFIAIAEETGLIVPIGEWVLRKTCEQVMEWLAVGLRAVPVAVNLSPAQFHQEDLLIRVASILNKTGMEASYLALEVTESTIMRETRNAREILSCLSELGVTTSINDFGTGYSALSSLKHLPFHGLKIDRTFVKDLAEGSTDAAITRAIIAMAHGLGLTVVAEGVDSQTQLDILREQDCDEIQGFLISRPVAAGAFAEMLRKDGMLEAEAAHQLSTKSPNVVSSARLARP